MSASVGSCGRDARSVRRSSTTTVVSFGHPFSGGKFRSPRSIASRTRATASAILTIGLLSSVGRFLEMVFQPLPSGLDERFIFECQRTLIARIEIHSRLPCVEPSHKGVQRPALLIHFR